MNIFFPWQRLPHPEETDGIDIHSTHLRCIRTIALIFFGVFILFISHLPNGWGGPSKRSYWVERYNALTPQDHPLVSKTLAIFNQVLAAADKRENRYPNLVILKNNQDLFALSLMDGTILLTQKAMTFCLDTVNENSGASRLAFVLGHEMAHLAKDDFWDAEAYHFMARYGSNKPSCNEIKAFLKTLSDLSGSKYALETLRKKELQADTYGLLYVTMAGYNPLSLFNPSMESSAVSENAKRDTFFHQWHRIGDPRKALIREKGLSSSKPETRSELVEAKIREIADYIVLFQLGVRLTQLGRYKDGLEFLTAFRKKFPCREVLNDIGLIYFQLALETLAHCDIEATYRFKLSTILDSVTRAQPLYKGTMRGASPCAEDRLFRHYLNESIRHFQAASDKDPFYAPAHVNLSSAYIIKGQYSAAVSEADKALTLKKDDPKALNNRAVAIYLMGPSIHVEMFDTAVMLLNGLIEADSEDAAARYNLAVIMSERKRNAAANEAWQRFLNVENKGIFAKLARKRLRIDIDGQSASESVEPAVSQNLSSRQIKNTRECSIVPPVKLGDMDAETMKQLQGFNRRILDIGTIFGEYFIQDGVSVLAIEGVVEIVECQVDGRFDLTEIIKHAGKAKEVLIGSVSTILLYDEFAVSRTAEKADKIIFFAQSN